MKINILIFSLCSLCAAAFCAGKSVFPEHPSFLQIRNASLTPEKVQTVKSARIIYSLNSETGETGVLMIRAKRPDQIRVDVFNEDGLYSVIQNKDKYWYYDSSKGISDMTEEEIDWFRKDAAYLAVPFSKDQVFTDPVFVKEEKVKNESRSVFCTKARGKTEETYLMSVDNATKQLRRVKITDAKDQVGFIVLYRNYEKVHGVDLAGNILVVFANENLKMTLCAADWDLQIEEDIFRKKKNMKDPETDSLMKYLHVEKNEKKEAELQKSARVSIAVKERRIRNLKLEIQEIETRIGKMEGVVAHNRESMTQIASGGGSFVWSGSGSWRGNAHHRRKSRRGSGRVSRRTLQKMAIENNSVENDYIYARDLLLKKRTELADEEALLQMMKGGSSLKQKK